MLCPNQDPLWMAATNAKISAVEENQTWSIVDMSLASWEGSYRLQVGAQDQVLGFWRNGKV